MLNEKKKEINSKHEFEEAEEKTPIGDAVHEQASHQCLFMHLRVALKSPRDIQFSGCFS